MSPNNEYIPGVCNIGPAEINRRRQAGWLVRTWSNNRSLGGFWVLQNSCSMETVALFPSSDERKRFPSSGNAFLRRFWDARSFQL